MNRSMLAGFVHAVLPVMCLLAVGTMPAVADPPELGYVVLHPVRTYAIRKACKAWVAGHGFCAACGTTKDLEAHHKKPLWAGGDPTNETNFVTLCGKCHLTVGHNNHTATRYIRDIDWICHQIGVETAYRGMTEIDPAPMTNGYWIGLTNWATTYTDTLSGERIVPSSLLTFSGDMGFLASINCSNGVVTVNTNMPMDEVARQFWKTLQECFPGSFPK